MSCPVGLNFHHLGIFCSDIERSIQWYDDILGFKVVRRVTHELPMLGTQPMAFLKNGNMYLELYHRPNDRQMQMMGDYVGTTGAKHINFWIADEEFDTFVEHLKSKNVNVFVETCYSQEECGKPTGNKVVYFMDPDNTPIEATDSYTPGEY